MSALRAWGAAASLATVLALGLALRWTTPSQAGDLSPRPDALRYEEAARNLARGAGYWLVVEGERYAPQNPFGFSALLVPVLWLWDVGPGSGVLLVQATALAGIAATWALGYAVGGVSGATAAAALLALSPAHVHWSRTVMSDVPSTCVVGWLAFGLLVALGRGWPPRWWLLFGILGGLAATIRFTNALILVPATLAFVFHRRSASRLLCLAAGAAIGLCPLLAYNYTRFGSSLTSGYDAWHPNIDLLGTFFGPEFVTGAPRGGGTPNPVSYARALAGLGDLYPWPVAILVLLGLIEAFRGPGPMRTFVLLALGFVLPVLTVQSLYFTQSTRFLVPVLPFLFAVGAVPLRSAPGPLRGIALGLAILAVGILATAPGAYAKRNVRGQEAATLREIDARIEPDAVLLVRTNGHLFELLLRGGGADRLWVPLGGDDRRSRIRSSGIRSSGPVPGGTPWIRDVVSAFDSARLEDAVRDLLRGPRRVYFSTLRQLPFMANLRRVLEERFVLEPIPMESRAQLFLVRERAP